MAANVPAPLPELTTADRELITWTRRHPNATKADFRFKNITDAGVAMLVQDRTCRVATVCRDIWQQLQSGDFAVRGGALLLVKQFILTPELTTIFLGNTGVTDAGAIALANKCPKLTKILLNGTGVTDAGAIALANKCPELTRIDLYGTGVTDAGAIALANKCPELTRIYLYGTGVTVACKRQMRQVRAGLNVYL